MREKRRGKDGEGRFFVTIFAHNSYKIIRKRKKIKEQDGQSKLCAGAQGFHIQDSHASSNVITIFQTKCIL